LIGIPLEQDEIRRLSELLDQRTMALMERESDLADRMEEIESQKEELTAAVEELARQNIKLETTLEELKERNRELDQILYRASHDLRSPITSIVGILNLLEYESLTPSLEKYVAHIRDKSSQMDEVLKSLSVLAKTISNDVHFSSVDLDQLVRICVGDLKFATNFSSVVIRTQTDSDQEITTDRLLVSIVIKNLLSNSLTFRDPKRDGLVLIKTSVSQTYFQIEVEDDGEGIPESVQDKIFDMFYRGSERSTSSGLGLYIVRKAVNRLNGSIEFSCVRGMTNFKIVLPAKIDSPALPFAGGHVAT
jgi:signal transduction histidine kinase